MPVKNIHIKWRATDLIDFEYLVRERFAADAGDTAEESDRQIYQAYQTTAPDIEKKPASSFKSGLFKYWLEQKRLDRRRSSGAPAILPGKTTAQILNAIRWSAAVFGLVIGAGLCGTLLSYSGKDPINIFHCLWAMIVPQVLLLLMLAASHMVRTFGAGARIRGLYPGLTGIFQHAFKGLLNRQYRDLPAAQRHRIEAVTGLIGQSRTIYGRILFRPLFMTGQIFGLFFNIGIIGVLLFRVAITDLAFGWQSTLQLAPETVYRIVQMIAAPWSWMLPGAIAHPSVSQIKGSQFVFMEGMTHLESTDLAAWWPFLCLTVIFYGLLPRLLIFAGTLVRQSRALKQLSFSHAACDRLLMAMTTARINTKSRAYAPPAEAARSPEAAAASKPQEYPTAPKEKLHPAVLMVPEDIAGQCPEDEARDRLRRRLGLDMKAWVICRIDPADDVQSLTACFPGETRNEDIRLVVIQEAWQPPIAETLSWIRTIRRQGGRESGLIIGLVGKPRAASCFTPPTDTDRIIWEQAISGLGDPYIRVEMLGA